MAVGSGVFPAFRKAVLAARAGAAEILRYYGKTKVLREKGQQYEIVTLADLKSEEAILRVLGPTGIPVVSEETRKETKIPEKGLCYFVDPLDGTANYSWQVPFFAVSVGITLDRVPVAGAIINPATREEFTALAGRGAFLNRKRIRVSENSDLRKTLINYCHLQNEENIRELGKLYPRMKLAARDFRRLGAGTLDLCYVAAGRNDAFFTLGFGGLWDVVAGAAIVREAGGLVTDFSGKEWELEDRNLVAANNPETKGKILSLLLDGP